MKVKEKKEKIHTLLEEGEPVILWREIKERSKQYCTIHKSSYRLRKFKKRLGAIWGGKREGFPSNRVLKKAIRIELRGD